jgi:iron(III) transport system substrate-binding protein
VQGEVPNPLNPPPGCAFNPRCPQDRQRSESSHAKRCTAGAAQGQVNIICSVQAEWCNMMATVYSRTTGTKVNMSMKGSGEALAQLIAEKDNPKTDIWFGGTGDPHLQAAEQGLTLEYKSPLLPQLHPWAQQAGRRTRKYRTVGIYLGPLGFGYNTELLAKKKAPAPKSWADLLKPEYKGEVQMANPASSGTAYTMIATLVQMMGEDKAFDYLKSLHKNISTYTRSGTGADQGRSAGRNHGVDQLRARRHHRGHPGLSCGFRHAFRRHRRRNRLHEHRQGRAQHGGAKKFYEWALTPGAQQFGVAAKQFQLPSKATAIDPRMPDSKKIKLINYDYAKYGASAERAA